MNFKGKVALVTGAGSPQGIGFVTARLLAQQGAKIAITSTIRRGSTIAVTNSHHRAPTFSLLLPISAITTEHMRS